MTDIILNEEEKELLIQKLKRYLDQEMVILINANS